MLRYLLVLIAALVLAGCSSSAVPAGSGRTQAPGATARPGTTAAPTATPVTTPVPTPNTAGWPAGAIGTAQAAQHVGQTGTVCGAVVSAEWTPAAKGSPTFLNLDVPYPGARFNVVIWGEQRREWPVGGKPEVALLGKTVCVTGPIESFEGAQQIAGASMASIKVMP